MFKETRNTLGLISFANVDKYDSIISSIWINFVLEQKVTTRLVVKDFWFIFSANILQFGNATYLFWWIVSFVNYDLFCLPLTMSWAQCYYIQWVYKAPLCFTLRIKTWVAAYFNPIWNAFQKLFNCFSPFYAL